MCTMDNGNDPPARIPFLEISDEKHDYYVRKSCENTHTFSISIIQLKYEPVAIGDFKGVLGAQAHPVEE